MFSIGGALRELQNVAGVAGGNWFTPRVGWNDPKTWYTDEIRRNLAKQAAGAPTTRYERTFVGGNDAPTATSGDGASVTGGYDSFGSELKPRPERASMAGLQRAAARGNPGWKAGGYK